MKIHNLLIVISISLFLLSACFSDKPGKTQKRPEGTWLLTRYNDQQPIASRQPTLQFEADQVSGTTGCNHYGGTYQIEGDTIRFDGIFSTEMACLEPVGIMDQEQAFLGLLRSTNHFSLDDGVLTFFADQQPLLVFEVQQDGLSTPALAVEEFLPTPTIEVVTPTGTPTFELPEGFQPYQDPVTGISVYIPKNWIVTGIIEGDYAILQSYPEDKYIGGEILAEGDTKCDLNIRPEGDRAADLIKQWKSDSLTTIVSEEEFISQSGLSGQRFVIDSMGRATVFITEVNQRVILLTCFGDFTRVDEIATTLNALK